LRISDCQLPIVHHQTVNGCSKDQLAIINRKSAM
jgi:hypothetical protein